MRRVRGHEETRRTVIIAGVANIRVGLAKLAAGIVTGSSAMLAEAAHSAADTLDQMFLLASLRQADRPATRDHPFGHGQERYFWALLAAFGIFIAGAGFSVFEGVLALTRSRNESPLLAYVAIAIAFVAEGTSLARAYWQVRGEARAGHEAVLDHVGSSPDITVKVALFEDSAAVVGLVLASLGVGLRQLTGSPALGRRGIDRHRRAADRRGRQARHGQQGSAHRPRGRSRDGAADTRGNRGSAGRPESLIAARVALNDDLAANQAEDLADEVDAKLAERLPLLAHVFIDPTQAPQSLG